MGTCACINKPTTGQEPIENLCSYPTKVTLLLKSPNSSAKVSTDLHLTKPISVSIEPLSINSQHFWVSFSILPGQDPQGVYFQKCMDSCMYLHNEFSILLCLFDGHGPEGEQVVNFCCSFTTRFYKSKPELIHSNPEGFLQELVELCDTTLRSSHTKIKTEYSGTTAVFVLWYNDQIFSASIGDSRAILASLSKRDPLLPIQNREENLALTNIKIRRGSKLPKEIHCLQLTKEHKPEDQTEAQRILNAGGRVKRLTDKEGNRVGPYRVWESASNSPGLTMSRSIGDSIAKTIGVSSTPEICSLSVDLQNDLFVVLGTDGIWDVMDNEDVLGFVENFREKSSRVEGKCKEMPCLGNCCIAQLLCEEARVRWMAVVEEDNVSIDDISCIVLEINKGCEGKVERKEGKRVEKSRALGTGVGSGGEEERIEVGGRIKDARRGSQVIFDVIHDG